MRTKKRSSRNSYLPGCLFPLVPFGIVIVTTIMGLAGWFSSLFLMVAWILIAMLLIVAYVRWVAAGG